MNKLTHILHTLEQGDPHAAEQLLPLVYEELHRLAAYKLAHEQAGHTLQPTALVHEAYLRLVGDQTQDKSWDHRGHFFAAAATAMRRILVERARHKQRAIHGGGQQRLELIPDLVAAPEPDEQILALHEALERLAERDSIKARLVDLRFFAGLTGAEAAAVLGISPSAADRHWVFARAWLRREMEGWGNDEEK